MNYVLFTCRDGKGNLCYYDYTLDVFERYTNTETFYGLSNITTTIYDGSNSDDVELFFESLFELENELNAARLEVLQ